MQTALIIQAVLTLLDWLEPRLAEARKTGEVTPDEQLALHNRIEKFRSSEAFSGPEWEPSDKPQSPTPTAPSDK